jgi:arylsulfatase A-like enzyme
MVKGYYRMISGVDMALGRLLDELKLLDRHKDTIIIFMGDNGYFLGERGFAGKWTMHDLSIRVPLIIHDPKLASARKGTVDSSLVLNIDIAPTILDMAGLSIPQGIQGRSLVPILNGSIANPRKEILTEHLWDHPEIPQTEAVRTQQWKYIRYPQHLEFEELYDLRCDPIEKNNFFRDKRYSEVRAKLSRILDQLIQKVS